MQPSKKFLLTFSIFVVLFIIFLALLPQKTNHTPLPKQNITQNAIPVPTIQPKVSAKLFKGNFHTHTEFLHALSSYDEIIKKAVELKLDFIVITDHDKVLPEVASRCPVEVNLLCLIGEEVSTSNGHLLAVGIKSAIRAGLPSSETIDLIHDQDGAAIAAHPTGAGGFSKQVLEAVKDKLDGLECDNARNRKSMNLPFLRSFAIVNNLGCVYDSDAHSKEQLAFLVSNCQMESLSFENLKTAVRSKSCQPSS